MYLATEASEVSHWTQVVKQCHMPVQRSHKWLLMLYSTTRLPLRSLSESEDKLSRKWWKERHQQVSRILVWWILTMIFWNRFTSLESHMLLWLIGPSVHSHLPAIGGTFSLLSLDNLSKWHLVDSWSLLVASLIWLPQVKDFCWVKRIKS